jgi:hypothetical protein
MGGGGLEGVSRDDRLTSVPDGDTTGHSVRGVSLCTLPGFSKGITPSSGEAHPQVPQVHL